MPVLPTTYSWNGSIEMEARENVKAFVCVACAVLSVRGAKTLSRQRRHKLLMRVLLCGLECKACALLLHSPFYRRQDISGRCLSLYRAASNLVPKRGDFGTKFYLGTDWSNSEPEAPMAQTAIQLQAGPLALLLHVSTF